MTFGVAPAFLLASVIVATLAPQTLQEFESYMRRADQEMRERARQPGAFLWAAGNPRRLVAVRAGRLEVGPWNKDSTHDVHDGLVHDWVASVFVPGRTARQALAVLQDFDSHQRIYMPEVARSRLLRREGDEFHSTLRLVKKKVVTVVLDTEYVTRYQPAGEGRWQGIIRSTRIVEIDHPGEKDEKETPVDTGYGFLWRLNSYWHIEERDGGVFLELRSISLTRDIPLALAWLVKPMVTGLPRESLVSTLEKTKKAVLEIQSSSIDLRD